MATQDNWRFCTKCYSLFWYGDPAKGVCPAKGTHSPFQAESPTNAGSSWDFQLQVASTSVPAPSPGGGGGASAAGTQGNWRFCTKCYSLFWYGYPTAGVCPAGAAHSPLESASPTHAGSSWDFQLQVVPNSPPAPSPGGGGGASAAGTQGNWRFCTKCYSLFWYGYPTAGVCPAGAAHSPLESASPTHAATSVDFALQVTSASGAPLPFTKMSWGPSGTGPLSDSATVGSGGNECQFQVSLSIQQDGTCSFSGYYENRGNWTFPNIGTAPPQAYVVAMIVLDAAGKGYTFTYSGEVPSAPQQGAVAQWNITQNCPVIAENWDSIAAKNYASYYWYNNYDESPLQVLGGWAGSALNWLQQNAGTIEEFVSIFLEAFSGGDGSDTTQVVIPRAPLPAGVPTGAAASAGGGSSGPQASGTPAGNLAPPIGAKIPIDIPPAATTPGS
jgi:hypothetical protein